MFTSEERAELRSDLLRRAASDLRLSGGAITGSLAASREDVWSDIDLAFGLANRAEMGEVLSDWTDHMYGERLAVHHLDTKFQGWIYRTFLLPSTLQVDLAFAPKDEFRALSPKFRLVFGRAEEPKHVPPPNLLDLSTQCWGDLVCTRAAIASGELWQADYLLSRARDNMLALFCIRHDLSAYHARGIDFLPHDIKAKLESSFAMQLCESELSRALKIMEAVLNDEIQVTEKPDISANVASGSNQPIQREHPPLSRDLVGLSWLYAVHARTCIRRRQPWQAEYMIRGVRDNAIGLACVRSKINADAAWRPNLLPHELRKAFEQARVRELNLVELSRAFQLIVGMLESEIASTEELFRERLRQTLVRLRESAS